MFKFPLLHLLHLWEPSPHRLSLLICEMGTVIWTHARVGVSKVMPAELLLVSC